MFRVQAMSFLDEFNAPFGRAGVCMSIAEGVRNMIIIWVQCMCFLDQRDGLVVPRPKLIGKAKNRVAPRFR